MRNYRQIHTQVVTVSIITTRNNIHLRINELETCDGSENLRHSDQSELWYLGNTTSKRYDNVKFQNEKLMGWLYAKKL